MISEWDWGTIHLVISEWDWGTTHLVISEWDWGTTHLVISEWDWGACIPGPAPGRVWWCGCCLCVRDSLSGAPGHCRTPYGETLSETSTTQNVDLSQQSHQSTQVYWARLISLTYWKLELVQHPVSERNWSSLIDQAHTCVHNTGTHFPLNKFNAQ